ncbi:hypothetical protein [Micromonospora sp. KC213]|uniref:hypothetical protein n=1 Tax=Micromonospora sp. KC213 TaxID=2530378 RepID=UPI001054106F|nr:hypothetical protein [Micromonospora sp. KC213]TDC29973.1 hypothetical protein E1166_29390 [Micromonospora sp. KC213]
MREFFATVAAIVVSVVLTGWLFMITVGVVRGEWLHDLPTIGFGSSMLVATLLGALVGVMRGAHTRSDN